MAKLYAPNKKYTGVTAGVAFAAGVGECDTEHLLKWFRTKGYRVEGDPEDVKPEDVSDSGNADGGTDALSELKKHLEEMELEELQERAEAEDIDLGRASSKEGIIKKILEFHENLGE